MPQGRPENRRFRTKSAGGCSSRERSPIRSCRSLGVDPTRVFHQARVRPAVGRQARDTAEFKLDEHTTFLRWVGTMDGHKIESLEVIVDNEQGLIVERTISLRPYPALKLFRDAMYASLKDKLPPDVWDYPTP